jgi:membrane protein involved in colicin uptake
MVSKLEQLIESVATRIIVEKKKEIEKKKSDEKAKKLEKESETVKKEKAKVSEKEAKIKSEEAKTAKEDAKKAKDETKKTKKDTLKEHIEKIVDKIFEDFMQGNNLGQQKNNSTEDSEFVHFYATGNIRDKNKLTKELQDKVNNASDPKMKQNFTNMLNYFKSQQ